MYIIYIYMYIFMWRNLVATWGATWGENLFRFCQGWAGLIESIPGLTRGLAGKWKRHDLP